MYAAMFVVQNIGEINFLRRTDSFGLPSNRRRFVLAHISLQSSSSDELRVNSMLHGKFLQFHIALVH